MTMTRSRRSNKIVPSRDVIETNEFNFPSPENNNNQQSQQPQQNVTNDLHLAAKIGDLPNVLIHLLSGINPFDMDEYDNIPVYYSSLHGHLLCCAVILIKMGGPNQLSHSDRDHCSVNALTLEIKRLFTGDIQPVDILKRDLLPSKPQQQSQEKEKEDGLDAADEGEEDGTMFGNLFQE